MFYENGFTAVAYTLKLRVVGFKYLEKLCE